MLVFDASTLILLAKVDTLGTTVRRLRCVAPASVRDEATCKRTFDAMAILRSIEAGHIEVVADPAPDLMARLRRDFPLARGETAALLVARKHRAVLATDDGVAIRACKILEVKFATAVHLLISAAASGEINRQLALAKLDLLQKYGRYSSRILEDAARRIHGGAHHAGHESAP